MDKKKVTIFGAGVTGLTAAHELVIRGFDVTVYDPEINHVLGPRTLDRGIGGMARSQFVVDPEQPTAPGEITELMPAPCFLRDATIEFDVSTDPATVKEARPKDALDRLIALYKDLSGRNLLYQLQILLPVDDASATQDQTDPRFVALANAVGAVDSAVDLLFMSVSFTVMSVPRPNLAFFGTGFHLFPAEHGFRFFPSFYRHLFDTMKRTPALSPDSSETDNHTVFDNLVWVDELGFARSGKARSFVLPRRPVSSFEEFRVNLDKVLGDLEWSGKDLARFTLKLFEYMTSCTKRRREQYEKMTWADFVDLQAYSSIMKQHIEFGPQMMASLRGSQSDARTQGNIVVQLLMDQVRTGTQPDGTLAGPTSGLWFNYWHDYLLSQNVTFKRGALDHFEHTPKGPVPVLDDKSKVEDGYVILALSLPAMAALGETLSVGVSAERADRGDIARVLEFAGVGSKLGETVGSSGPLRDMSGIQFYFGTEVKFWRGHTQYLDSEWGLTSIAQPQFWYRARGPVDAYRSLLSVDIGIWDRPTKPYPTLPPDDRRSQRTIKKGADPVTASQCAPSRIAKEVWAQIEDGHDQAFAAAYGNDAVFPYPVSFAIDQALSFTTTDGVTALSGNRYPFVVNAVGQYATRPGKLATSAPKAGAHYEVLWDRFVLAGTYMQTYTRITSMESANESARHAVNAILKHARAACDRCEIWDPEDNELPDLQWLRDLDEAMFDRGSPHFVRVLGWTELPDAMPNVTRALFEKGIRGVK